MLSRLQILLHGASSPGAGLPPAPPGCGRSGGTRPNGFHLAAMLGEGDTAAFKFSTRNLSESPAPHPSWPLWWLFNASGYFEPLSSAGRGTGQDGSRSCLPSPSVNPRLSDISTYSVRVNKPFPQALYSKGKKVWAHLSAKRLQICVRLSIKGRGEGEKGWGRELGRFVYGLHNDSIYSLQPAWAD